MDLDRQHRRGDAAVIWGLLLGMWTTANAGVLTTYGGSTVGGAGNAGATVESPLSAWYNPASMRTPRIEESVEWLYGSHRFTHNGQRIPVTPDANGLLIGAVVGGYWFNVPAVHIGLATYLPLVGPFGWWEPPEGWDKTAASPQVPRFGDELNRLEVALAANAWVTPWLAVGVGVDASADVETITIAVLDDIDRPEQARKAQEISIKPTFHPYAGVLVVAGQPDGQQLRLGLVGRAARDMHDYGTSHVKILALDAIYSHDYSRYQAPRSLTMGVAVDGLGPLELRAESTYAAWSEVEGPYGEDLGLAWRNTMDLRLGAEARWDEVALQVGRSFDPGPLVQVPVGTAHLDAPSSAWTAGLTRKLVQTRMRVLNLQIGIHRTAFDAGVVPDPSGEIRRFTGVLTAMRVGIELGHLGETKEALWSK